MIAECNIKVNGRWIRAGESYEAPGEKKPEPKAAKAEQAPEAENAEEPKTGAKPKSTARRKVSK